jgi:dipeptidyl aminopeptidase/acylaminoacyl peptidase
VEIAAELCVTGRDLTEPRPSPAGGAIAFASRAASWSAVVAVPIEGGPERTLTTWPPPATGRGVGGGCFDWVPDGSGIVYAAVDGELWLQPLGGGGPRRLTAFGRTVEGPVCGPDSVVAVVDQAEVWRVPLDRSESVRLDDGRADFCLDPTVAPSGSVAWLAWDVPDMPWDGARVEVVGSDGARRVVRGDGALQQPRFGHDGALWAVRDDDGWLNVWREDDPVIVERHEHGGPTWGSGQRSFAVSPDGARVAVARNEDGFGRLCVHDRATGVTTEIARGVHAQLSWSGDRLVAVRSGARTPTQVVVYEGDQWERRVLAVGPPLGWDGLDLPEPEVVVVAGPAGPVPARRYGSGAGRVLVAVHGGPTDQWQVTFHPRVAYWWSRGWDVVVPDPRGSTGHGRAHQQALRGGWGVADVADVAAVIDHAHANRWCTPATTAVLGSSSGGLAALGVVVRHPGRVAAAVVSSPVTDLAALVGAGHRFEAHAALTLVGPPDDVDAYRAGSPLAHAERIDVPVLVLHGDADPVVPVEQSQRLAAARPDLVELHVLPGEGHGFRLPEHRLAELGLGSAFLDRHVPRPRGPTR